MCGVFVSLFVTFIAIAAYLMGAAILAVIVILLGFFISNANYENAKKMKPTPMICPNCKSRNVKIRREVSGISGGSMGSYHGAWAVRSSNHTINRQRIGVCLDCGFDFPYITEQEVKQAIANAKNKFHFWTFLTIIAAGIAVWMFLHR